MTLRLVVEICLIPPCLMASLMLQSPTLKNHKNSVQVASPFSIGCAAPVAAIGMVFVAQAVNIQGINKSIIARQYL